MAQIITVTSGKGGVGKTSISLNLCLALAAAGKKVCLFDADLGLANVNILTGIYPEYGLEEVFSGSMGLEDIMAKDIYGVDIIPGASGVEKMADLTESQALHLIDAFLGLKAYEYFVFDTSAGISAQVLAFCRTSHEMLLVVTCEPTSLTDAYSLLKVLAKDPSLPLPRVRVVVNQVKTATAAKTAYAKLRQTVEKFLSVPVSSLGIVAHDPNVPIAVVSQIPYLAMFPDSIASKCIRNLASKLEKGKDPAGDIPLETFWDQCLHLIAAPKPKKRAGGADPEFTPGTLNERLFAIEKNIAALLDEMSQIRALLTTGPAPSFADSPSSTAKIALDFEGWLEKQTP